MTHNFGPASRDETIVFGASRPGAPSHRVEGPEVLSWIAAMKENGIQRLVCLLHDKQLVYYDAIPGGLVAAYASAFGHDNILTSPVEDFHLIDFDDLESVINFLMESDASRRKVVVHCSGGSGRTGHVLAAWLTQARGYEPRSSLDTVAAMPGRNPYEAVQCGNATQEQLTALVQGKRN